MDMYKCKYNVLTFKDANMVLDVFTEKMVPSSNTLHVLPGPQSAEKKRCNGVGKRRSEDGEMGGVRVIMERHQKGKWH